MKKYTLPACAVLISLFLLVIAGCSPDPNTLIFHKSREEGIWRIKADGTGEIQISSSGWFAEYSPNNRQIAFSEFYDEGVWVMKSNGKNAVRLTTAGSSPSWSPDGKQLVYYTGGARGADRYLWIVNADGTNPHQLSRVNGSFPDWSPKGDKIIFHGEVNNGIWLISPDGSAETVLDPLGAYPAWSPDGKEIAFINLNDWCVWVMQADGTGKRKLTERTGLQPTWSSDGKQIAYEVSGGDEAGLWIVNVDGTGDHQLIDHGMAPDWSQ
jgi:Tol biopolymer transport system component